MPFIGNKPSAVPLTSADIADSIITSAKIVDGTIVNADINASAAIAGTKLTGVGITVADQFRLTTNLTGTNAVISSNLERVDTAGQGTLGTGMTESSGIFTFPSTGIWFVIFDGLAVNNIAADNIDILMQVTIDNSSYTTIASAGDSSGGIAQNSVSSLHCNSIIDVTNTTNVKVRFSTSSFGADAVLLGSTTQNLSAFTFVRLGDT
jgi:hypothetical protein